MMNIAAVNNRYAARHHISSRQAEPETIAAYKRTVKAWTKAAHAIGIGCSTAGILALYTTGSVPAAVAGFAADGASIAFIQYAQDDPNRQLVDGHLNPEAPGTIFAGSTQRRLNAAVPKHGLGTA